MNVDVLAADPFYPRFVLLLVGFLLVVLWLRGQPEWLLAVPPLFALTFLGFDRLAGGVGALVDSGDVARLVVGAALMAGPAFALGFAIGRRAGRPAPAPGVPAATDGTLATARTDLLPRS
jgi:hypothetical protein